MRRSAAAGAAAVLLGLLAGCMRVTVQGHTVSEGRAPLPPEGTPADAAPGPVARTAAPGAVAAVRVVNRLRALPRPVAGERFDVLALRRIVEADWQARRLLDVPLARHTAEVVVDTLELERTGSAVVFGQVAVRGRLAGMVRVRDAGGGEVRGFAVRAESDFALAGDAAADAALEPLYRAFAAQAAALLALHAER